jgi:hypothetical protein
MGVFNDKRINFILPIKPQMNKFKFTVNNALLYYKFWNGYKIKKIEYPEITDHEEKTYGKPVYKECFENLDQWKVTDKGEWGSARPDNICVFVKENVSLKKNKGQNSLVITSTPDKATGKDWKGNTIERIISSGLVASKFRIKPGQAVSATVNASQSYPGSWFSFWLFKMDVEGDHRYREADIFEKFMEKPRHKQYKISLHGGTKTARELLNFNYPLYFVDEEKMTFTCEMHQAGVKIFLNGIQICQADEPNFDGQYHVIFNDLPSTHKGKVKEEEEEIVKYLPGTFEIVDFRVYNL